MEYDVLVACEFSGIVRDAFIDEGYDAVSCDLRDTESPGPHIVGDVFDVIDEYEFQLLIAHPPCTYLANSGVRWLHEKDGRWQQMVYGALFFKDLLECDIPHRAVENPIMHKYAKNVIESDPDQIVQPWQFGNVDKKATCWWLRNLPELEETEIIPGREREAKVHQQMSNSKERSRFFDGMASAMADQWGSHVFE